MNYFSTDPTAIFQKHQIQAAFVFGSQVHGYARSDSDIDIALFVPNKRQLDQPELYAQLRPLFVHPDKLDLVIVDFTYTTPLLLFEIVKGQLLYEHSPNLGNHLKARVMHLYFDDEHRRKIKYSYTRSAYANQ